MSPKLFTYLHAENVTQNKCVQKRKKSNSAVRGQILMKFWHQIFWSQTILTVPSDLLKTRLGPSYGPKRAEKMKLWKRLPGHFSCTFTQKNQKYFVWWLFEPIPTSGASFTGIGLGDRTRPYTKVLHFLIFCLWIFAWSDMIQFYMVIKSLWI